MHRSLIKKLYGRPPYSSRVWTCCTNSCVSTATVRSYPSCRPMTGESYWCAKWSSARCKYFFSRHNLLRCRALPTIGRHGGPRARSEVSRLKTTFSPKPICRNVGMWCEVKWSGRKFKWGQAKWKGSEVKWSEVKWSEVKWSEVKWSEVKWSDFILNWTEVKWVNWSEWSEVTWSEVK